MYDAFALAKRMIFRYFKTYLICLYLKAKVAVQLYNSHLVDFTNRVYDIQREDVDKQMSSKRDIDVFRIFIMDLDWLQAAVGTMVYVPRRGGVYAFGSR